MADTLRTLADLQSLLADNTAGDISPQDVRDFLVSVHGGGLTPNAQTLTTADLTGAVGQLYVCTIAGLTANRNLTLPSASPGQRMGVYVADGDDTYALILIGAASQTINGGSAATEWSRVFIKGECVVFLCVAANTWIVESDARIPCRARIYLATSATDYFVTANTFYNVPTDTVEFDNCSIASVANDNFVLRRGGTYLAGGSVNSTETNADQAITISVWDGTYSIFLVFGRSATAAIHGVAGTSTINVSAGDTISFRARFSTSTNVDALGSGANNPRCMQFITEIL